MNLLPSLILLAAAAAPQTEEEQQPAGRYVRIGHYQCECRQGDFEANLKTVLRGLKLAQEARVQIMTFPESFLTGFYARRDDAWKNSFATDSPEMRRVAEQTAGYATLLMVGYNERRGEKLYNTVAVIDQGRVLGTYSKAFPEPYFSPGRDFPVFEKHGLVFGVVICADGGYIEPARILALKGAKMIFAPHFNFVADPVEHYQTVRSDHIARAVENSIYFVRANNCVTGRRLSGFSIEGHGYGDSYIIDPNGQVVAGAGLYDENLMIYNLDLNKKHRSGGVRRSRASAVELLGALEKTLQNDAKPPKSPH